MKPHDPRWLVLADAGLLQKVYFVRLDWPTGLILLHTYKGKITVDGETWKGIGTLGTMEHNGAAQANQKPVITLKVSNVPDGAAGFMTAEGVEGRAASIYMGVKDPYRDDLRLIGGLVPEIFGRIGPVDMNFREADKDGVLRFDYTIAIEVGRSPRLPLTYFHSDADQRRRTKGHPDGPDTALGHLAAAYASPPVWTPT